MREKLLSLTYSICVATHRWYVSIKWNSCFSYKFVLNCVIKRHVYFILLFRKSLNYHINFWKIFNISIFARRMTWFSQHLKTSIILSIEFLDFPGFYLRGVLRLHKVEFPPGKVRCQLSLPTWGRRMPGPGGGGGRWRAWPGSSSKWFQSSWQQTCKQPNFHNWIWNPTSLVDQQTIFISILLKLEGRV